jgi:hypothetical protein
VPLCVHVTGNDEIVFGVVDQNSYEVDTRCIRLIIKMTMDGDILHEYQFDDRIIRLFTIPIQCIRLGVSCKLNIWSFLSS